MMLIPSLPIPAQRYNNIYNEVSAKPIQKLITFRISPNVKFPRTVLAIKQSTPDRKIALDLTVRHQHL
jgi:hypothetical protein